jgi:serralysin
MLTGLDGNDRLNGGVGADTMIGGTGNDTYVVDNVGDVVTEAAGEGTADTVQTTLSNYALGDNVERLAFTGTGDFSGTGNTLNNTITGAAGADILTGLGGNDMLDGKAGADTMIGGTGNDTYVVDNAGDVVTELASEGSDTVKTTLSSYTLDANVENLTFTGAGNFLGTGNTLNNAITGGTGSDTLVGGLGKDKLTGGAGADIFQFSAGDSTVASFDTVADFATGTDKMDLSIFAGVPSASAYAEITVASDSFATLKSAAQAQMTATVQAVFVAATTNGWLFWNTDANPGTAEEAVMLTGKNNVSNFGFGDLT